jgi:hypothetical protein
MSAYQTNNVLYPPRPSRHCCRFRHSPSSPSFTIMGPLGRGERDKVDTERTTRPSTKTARLDPSGRDRRVERAKNPWKKRKVTGCPEYNGIVTYPDSAGQDNPSFILQSPRAHIRRYHPPCGPVEAASCPDG